MHQCHGVHATQIARWKKEALEAMISGFQIRPKAIDTTQIELIRIALQANRSTHRRARLVEKKSETFGFDS